MVGVTSSYNSRPERQAKEGTAVVRMPRLYFRSISYRSRTFIRNHSHLFLFFGTFIVFFTFLAKEGVKEDLKETAEAISSARRTFVDASEHRRMSAELDEIKSTVQEVHTSPETAGETSLMKEVRKLKEGDNSWTRTAVDTIDSLKGLVKVVGLDQEEVYLRSHAEKNRAEIQKQLTTVLSSQKDLIERLGELNSINQRPFCEAYFEEECSMDLGTLRDRAVGVAFAADTQLQNILKLADRLLELADREKEKKEHYAAVAKWLGRIFFVVGWSLGLLGKLYGVPEATGGE